jgi:hypothetical protein
MTRATARAASWTSAKCQYQNSPRKFTNRSARLLACLPQSLVHLLHPVVVPGLERREDVSRQFFHSGQLARASLRLVPPTEGSVTADENFQRCPPVWPNLLSPNRGVKGGLRPSGEKLRQRKQIEPCEVLRVIGTQPQPVLQRRNGVRCAPAEQQGQTQTQVTQRKTGADVDCLSGRSDRLIKLL